MILINPWYQINFIEDTVRYEDVCAVYRFLHFSFYLPLYYRGIPIFQCLLVWTKTPLTLSSDIEIGYTRIEIIRADLKQFTGGASLCTYVSPRYGGVYTVKSRVKRYAVQVSVRPCARTCTHAGSLTYLYPRHVELVVCKSGTRATAEKSHSPSRR